MDAATAPFNVLSDTYNVWVPIEDTELMKSVEVDANGDWIVQGVMTSNDKDEEDDSITPDGMDCSYFLTKGWIKYEHGNNPNQFIGEPMEIRVGQFTHPKLQKSVNGVYVKGRLFQNRELARQAVRAIEDLQKSHTKRTVGWSIEGNVKERCRTTGKILKSVLRNVVLTMNPVNTMTWAELAKSFAKNHEVEIDTVDKSLAAADMGEIAPQSLEGAKDPQEEWVRMFRKFVFQHAIQKSIRVAFLQQTAGLAGVNAYRWAAGEGLAYEDACEFASYISGRYNTLKSLIGQIGGEKMSTEKNLATLAAVLDTDLEELQKSLETDDELGEEELKKSQKADADKDNKDNKDDDDGEDDDGEDDDGEDDDDKGDDDDDDNKGGKSNLSKSLAELHPQAFEASEFLAALADQFGFGVEGLQKSLTHVAKQQITTVNALVNMGELIKSMAVKMDAVSSENADLKATLEEVLHRPVGRKSVVNQREVQTITKSMAGGDGKDGKSPLTRQRVKDVLEKSFDAGNMALGDQIIRFDAGVPVDKLHLPADIKTELGLA